MEVLQVIPRGYCKGVTRAISIAKKTASDHPDKKIYVLGMLVHNRYVMEALQSYNIQAVEDKSKSRMELLDCIPDNSIVIFTAHGIAPEVIQKANEKGLHWVDASCPDVVKTQALVMRKLAEGKEIFYIGKAGHPEAEAITSLSKKVHLITSKQDLVNTHLQGSIFVTNQTTMSIYDIEELFQMIKQQYPKAVFSEEICNATRIRQQAVHDLDKQNIDILYVVGDSQSNNSSRLASIGKESGIKDVYLIDDVRGIDETKLSDEKRIAVTSGASTPTYLTNQVIQYLKEYKKGLDKPIIELQKIL